jgi:hypothetical protein
MSSSKISSALTAFQGQVLMPTRAKALEASVSKIPSPTAHLSIGADSELDWRRKRHGSCLLGIYSQVHKDRNTQGTESEGYFVNCFTTICPKACPVQGVGGSQPQGWLACC